MKELLQGRIALVTGAAAGIGRATAIAFAEQGAAVAVMDTQAAGLDSLRAEFREHDWPLIARVGDVCSTADIRGLLEEVDAAHGRLDVLVNNVGGFLGIVKPLAQMSDQEIDDLLNINLRQIMICCREATSLLRRSASGSIIAISSIEGFRAMPNITPYGAAKLGLFGMVRSLALELAADGIRVNAIAPETTETEHVTPSQWMAPEDVPRQKQWIPLGRFGQPEDTAGCALFLASDLSRWVTGTTVHCDGGALAAAGWYRSASGAWTNTPLFERGAFDHLQPTDSGETP